MGLHWQLATGNRQLRSNWQLATENYWVSRAESRLAGLHDQPAADPQLELAAGDGPGPDLEPPQALGARTQQPVGVARLGLVHAQRTPAVGTAQREDHLFESVVSRPLSVVRCRGQPRPRPGLPAIEDSSDGARRHTTTDHGRLTTDQPQFTPSRGRRRHQPPSGPRSLRSTRTARSQAATWSRSKASLDPAGRVRVVRPQPPAKV